MIPELSYGVSDKKITDMKQEEIDKLTNALNAIIPQNESTETEA